MDGSGLRFETLEHGGEFRHHAPSHQAGGCRRPLLHLRPDAAELLTNASEHGQPIEFARIAGANRRVERTFSPNRKDTDRDRKLARDR
jgi:hypothetical protein